MAKLTRWRGGLLRGNRREADMTQGSFNMGYSVKTPGRLEGYDPKKDTEWLVRMDPSRHMGQGRLFTDRREVDDAWKEKATIGDSIHTDSYYLSQDYGKYYVTSDEFDTNIGLRRLHRGDNGVAVGNYQGQTGLISKSKEGIIHAYQGDPITVNFLGFPAKDFKDFKYYPVTKFVGARSFGLPQVSLFEDYTLWLRLNEEGTILSDHEALARFKIYYEDSRQELFASHSDYEWEKGGGIPIVPGEITHKIDNYLSIDLNRPIVLIIELSKEMWVAGEEVPNTGWNPNDFVSYFDTTAYEVIVDQIPSVPTGSNLITDNDLGNSEFSVADIHDEKYAHSLHLKDLQILTADDDEPILFTSRWDGQDEGQSEWAVVNLFDPIPDTLHLRSEEILTGDDGIPILFTN
ncbi:hypothetical protein [Pseudoalteromonas phage vB_PtuP_Slicky01]|nr:hypothetical protein [Pseudoalteromonas phage vB_PtuP_Slicky01]